MTLRWANSKKTLGNKNKAAHRGVLTAKVTQGGHRVGAVPGDKLEDRSLRTFHFPWRSYEQFEQKVITLGRAYRQNIELPYAVGRLRRGLYELWEQGELESYYAEQLAVGSGGGEGIVEDPLLRDFMRSILTREETESQPGSPEDAAQELSGRP
jgi:hypothetical protein